MRDRSGTSHHHSYGPRLKARASPLHGTCKMIGHRHRLLSLVKEKTEVVPEDRSPCDRDSVRGMVRGQGRSTGEVPVQRGSGLPARADLLATHRGKLPFDCPTGSPRGSTSLSGASCSVGTSLLFPLPGGAIRSVNSCVNYSNSDGRPRETGALEYTRHPCTFSKHELAKGYLQLTPRVRSRGPERSQAVPRSRAVPSAHERSHGAALSSDESIIEALATIE
jgi:hypothetical protein